MKKDEFNILIKDIRENPSEWVGQWNIIACDFLTLRRQGLDLEIWIGNGFFFYGMYLPKIEFSLVQKFIFMRALAKLPRESWMNNISSFRKYNAAIESLKKGNQVQLRMIKDAE